MSIPFPAVALARLPQLFRGGRRWLGLGLLGLSFIVAGASVYLGSFVDEGAVLGTAALMARGQVLYRDVFSHHMPAAYYWVAGALTLLGHTILAARLSYLFFTLLTFALLMRFTGAYVTVGLAALAWGAVAHLYGGHMVMYHGFAGVGLMLVFGVALAHCLGALRQPRLAAGVMGVYAAVTLLANPLTVWPLGWVFVVLGALWLRRRHTLLAAVAVCAACLGVYLAYLLLSGTFTDFYQEVIQFNRSIYSHYTNTDPLIYLRSARNVMSRGLDLFRPDLWLAPVNVGPVGRFPPLLAWLFSGFLYRLAVWALCGLLLARRQWLPAAFLYVFIGLTLARSNAWFRQPAFVLAVLVALALVLDHWLRQPPRLTGGQWLRSGAWLATALALSAGLLWPVVAGGVSLWAYRRELSYAHNFGGAEARAAEMERLAGGHAARLGYYPGDPLIHMLSGLPPVAGYLYMFPWVAEVAQAEVIADLAQGPAIVFLQTEASIWGRPVGQYLAPLQAFLEANYVQVGPNLYVSPDLYRSESDKRPGP